jgi:hypothetical protein
MILFSMRFNANAQSISFQRDFVAEFHYQNIPDLTIDFQKYRLQYKFEKPFLVQLNTESWSYNDIFENQLAYRYVGFGIGTYTSLFKGLQVEFGLTFEKAIKRDFIANTQLGFVQNLGSIDDIETYRTTMFGSLTYEQTLYKDVGLSLGMGVQSILNPFDDAHTYNYNNQTNVVNDNRVYSSGVTLFYTISFGITYDF